MKRIPVEVSSISVCAPYQGYVIILKEREGKRWLPIFIGVAEAHNISLLLQGLKYLRPLTYDLFHNILDAVHTEVDSVTVTDLRENTFFAEIQISPGAGRAQDVDARPSDAIAIAIKTKAPIFVSSRVMEEAGLVGEGTSMQPDVTEQIHELHLKLDQAVEREAYEDAARLRDQIRALEDRVNVS